ncbi:uncharacterized protein MONBRDRAFT_33635 [Monosiga brevicollis MX1]|uniref:Translation initiation factor IF2/IF5 domain-containing protein n=1 Tax=Monosiga brevicollis TaxID=81824 RepID=A9V6Q5_MONBE|nr:uncharacterized protein MONBRDRAFT_33635 [Monosiga brevicollis MX1]EDQ86775.1 predicted protein [Monosiga brevicollis MX1]|eukprot:XP_001748320.1 hypothetical protein [Monosiga brevicollis MX1]
MTEEDLNFDPTLKKKKKKKKILASFDDEVTESSTDAPEPVSAAAIDENEEEDDLPKPTKVAVVHSEDLDKPVSEELVTMLISNDIDYSALKKRAKRSTDALEEPDSLDFSKKKKKKKKTAKAVDQAPLEGDAVTSTADDGDEGTVHPYSVLLDRVFAIIKEKNPELISGEKKKFTMKPPQVVRLGAKKTGFVNITDICKLLHRQQDHMLAFLFAELGTSGSVDASNCLVIKGRFQQKQIESILRKYIREYVTCHTCRSPNTILAKYNRLYFLTCEACGSRQSVANINSGFQAVTGRRAALRAKAQ